MRKPKSVVTAAFTQPSSSDEETLLSAIRLIREVQGFDTRISFSATNTIAELGGKEGFAVTYTPGPFGRVDSLLLIYETLRARMVGTIAAARDVLNRTRGVHRVRRRRDTLWASKV